ncbi:Acetyl-coenzyme A carboxylase carboxyl transferase subunit beta, partial [Dissostichus eleginoides]
MSGESQGREASCQAEESVSWKQCIICQSDDDKKGVLVQHPKLEYYGLVLQAVQERASLNDGDYVQDDGQQLYQVRTENAGKNLKEAVERSHNTALKTRLNTCISPDACEENMVNTMTPTDKEKEENSMKTIYKAAQVIRKSFATFTKERNVLQVSSDITDVPAELYTMIHWIMVGPAEKLETEKRTRVVDRATLTNPQVLGLALTIHHDTRNKKLMNLLNAHGYSVSHGRALLMETALANAVVENTRAHQGLYVPPFLRKGTFVFFAADKTDFAKDTRDGKGTTHGTITAVYQKIDPSKEPVAEPLIIGDAQSLSVTPYHTVIMQANQLRKLAVEEDHPTVITFDMALYEKVVQLLDAKPDLKKMVVPRLGELHVVMAALRALGASMENSGIDDAWMEADVYGPATTRQILKCTHYKRALHAHIYSYVALYEMALEEFFKDNAQLKYVCLKATEGVEAACSERKDIKAESVKQVNRTLLEATAEVITAFQEWEEQKSQHAMFKAMMSCLHRVETILFFVAATRNADLELHLQAGEALSKLFFAMDRIKYKRLWPRYIADMHDLRINHPQTWEELHAGNIAVTKSVIPFVSVGADHACEHLNKLMKIRSGIIGISNNANARQRFVIVTPELSRLSKEFKSQFDMEADRTTEHHELGPSAVKRAHATIDKIKAAILSHGNPFTTEGDKLYNVITLAYIPDEYVPQILNADVTGQKLYEDYVSERINGDVSLWAPVKKVNNKMFLSGNKKITVKLRDNTVDLKETKDLFARLMVLARSNRDINQKEAIGNYEFTLTPRALFASNGTILPCHDKSKLINLLEKLTREDVPHEDHQLPQAGSTTHQDAMDTGFTDTTSTDQP